MLSSLLSSQQILMTISEVDLWTDKWNVNSCDCFCCPFPQSTSDIVQGFAVPTPKVPLLPPFNGLKTNGSGEGLMLKNLKYVSSVYHGKAHRSIIYTFKHHSICAVFRQTQFIDHSLSTILRSVSLKVWKYRAGKCLSKKLCNLIFELIQVARPNTKYVCRMGVDSRFFKDLKFH